MKQGVILYRSKYGSAKNMRNGCQSFRDLILWKYQNMD